MKKFGRISLTFLLVIAGAFIAVWTYSTFFNAPQVIHVKDEQAALKYTSLPAEGEQTQPDLTYAAENSVHAVVHIATKSVYTGEWSSGNPIFDQFFGLQRSQPQVRQGFGSGVILSKDGYIVTNNHVVEDAQEVKVILNDKREFQAKIIGTDPSTDLALLKIDADNLPFLTYGDSEALKLGEWVLAVGNPFNLTSTVTAGIVSARARNLGINQDAYSIESFIQTDAAVNPGNSGGALVNQQGKLVGINAAIASRTGSYTGYSFAIPVSIVKKIVEDLKQFGEVQRALLGVNIGDVNAEIANKLNLNRVEGVYVGGVVDNGAAKEAGIKAEDVIVAINGENVKTSAELQEKVSQYRPGDDIKVTVLRDNKEKQFTVTLRNKHGDTQIVRDNTVVLGAEFDQVAENVKNELDINSGIVVTSVKDGKLKDIGIKKGFIITAVNKKPVNDVNDFKREIGNARGGIFLEGVYPNGEYAYYVLPAGDR
ncbi:MAG TPA: Do family serine endopeptidase [Draconibacterium sp.]|nr:Do family serine endopeptidase [Draconibacterium sp.]